MNEEIKSITKIEEEKKEHPKEELPKQKKPTNEKISLPTWSIEPPLSINRSAK